MFCFLCLKISVPQSHYFRNGVLFLLGRVIVTGDSSQKDLAAGVQSGLDVAERVLGKISDIAFIRLTSRDVVSLDQPLLHIFLKTLCPHDLIQRIIQRPQVRIHFTLQIPRQKTEFLP